MSYPISTEQIDDPFVRGQVDMFAKLVEYQNKHPKQIDDAVIDFLREEVKNYCDIDVRKSVYLLKDGEIITE